MKDNILVAIGYLKTQAEVIEGEIDALNTGGGGGSCPNCGFLTQEALDLDQEMRVKISALTELTEALDYLEART
jgi:hypothetical protein